MVKDSASTLSAGLLVCNLVIIGTMVRSAITNVKEDVVRDAKLAALHAVRG